jgi:hypothetical protein
MPNLSEVHTHLVENRELAVASRQRQSGILAEELRNFGGPGQHDDMVLAAALAAWFTRHKP